MKCPKCKTVNKKLILKMGGLICPKCRVIIYEAYSDEWYAQLEKMFVLNSPK